MSIMILMPIVVALSIGYSYFLALHFFQLFFAGKTSFAVYTRKSLLTAFSIFVVCLLITVGTWSLPDEELGNRILHTFAGGFLVFIAFFLAARTSEVPFSRFQFFTLAFLCTTALGVLNELVEFLLQARGITHFAYTITDTWLDLVSNIVGCIFAGLLLRRADFSKNKN